MEAQGIQQLDGFPVKFLLNLTAKENKSENLNKWSLWLQSIYEFSRKMRILFQDFCQVNTQQISINMFINLVINSPFYDPQFFQRFNTRYFRRNNLKAVKVFFFWKITRFIWKFWQFWIFKNKLKTLIRQFKACHAL